MKPTHSAFEYEKLYQHLSQSPSRVVVWSVVEKMMSVYNSKKKKKPRKIDETSYCYQHTGINIILRENKKEDWYHSM